MLETVRQHGQLQPVRTVITQPHGAKSLFSHQMCAVPAYWLAERVRPCCSCCAVARTD